jgi:selenocysteine lyase/cysteine desulfurase
MLFTRREVLASLDVPKLDPAPDEGSERLETGTQNHEGMVGTEAAIDFIASWGTGDTRRARIVNALRLFHDRGEALITRLWQGLERINGVVLHGPRPGSHARTPTLSFSVDGMLADEVAAALVPHGLFLSSGDFYATSVIEALGRTSSGVVRAGCACYTTDEEVDRLLGAVAALKG